MRSKQLRILFWKEWRDHRATLITIAAALPVLLGLAFWAFGDRLLQDHWRREPTVLLLPFVALLVVVAAGSELIAGEVRRDTLGFLLRAPSSLLGPLCAKLAFYVVAMICMVGWSLVLLLLTHGLCGHLDVFGEALRNNGAYWQDWTVLVAFAGAWVILASCWVPRGSGAVLGGLLLLGLVALPIALFVQAEPKYFLAPEASAWGRGAFESRVRPFAYGFGAWAGLTALTGIVLSFVVGRRYGRGVWSSAWRGLATVALFVCATTAWGSHRMHTLHALAPDDPTFHIHGVQVLQGERWALATVGKHSGPKQVWAIDLINGDHRSIAPPDAMLNPFGHAEWLGHQARFLRSVTARSQRLGRVYFYEGRGGDRVALRRWFDGESGEILKTLPTNVHSAAVDAIYEGELQRWTTVKARDGRRAWLCRGSGRDARGALAYAVGGPDGSVERHRIGPGVQPVVETRWGWVASVGWRSRKIWVIAPFAEPPVRVIRLPRLSGKNPRFFTLWDSVVAAPSPGRLLLRMNNRLYWLDEKGGLKENEIEGLSNFGPAMRQIDDTRRVSALRAGERVQLYFDVDTATHVERAKPVANFVRAVGEGQYLGYVSNNALALADAIDGPLRTLPNGTGLSLVGEARERSIFAVQNGKRIVRYDYRTGETEVVWPR